MILDRVTFTGADDSVDPQDLIELSLDFPFAEWGILYGSGAGGPRFPSEEWVMKLLGMAPPAMRLSAHLCSHWVRNVVTRGVFTFGQMPLAKRAQRIQLNFHGHHHAGSPIFGALMVEIGHADHRPDQWIFQMDGVNDQLWRWADAYTHRAVPLFDTSGGAGIVPREWPQAYPGVYCGYAGGLGPDNVREELGRINEAAGPARVWIDMERRVRSDDDALFDLDKVRRVCQLVEPFVTVPAG